MTDRIDLYDTHYRNVETDAYREVRVETYGEDLGQASWITAAECDEFCRWLGLRPGKSVLEVACGSGGASVRIADRFGCSVIGIDVNPAAIAAATARAEAHDVADGAEFRVVNADESLPFPDESFDAVFCNDAINHFRDRRELLAEWHRVLRGGGRCLYTDPIVVTGGLSSDEIAARSSIGFYVFTPVGANEELLRSAGFRVVLTSDVTEAVVSITRRWREARARRTAVLSEIEGESKFEDVQGFLGTVHALASEGRLSRFAFMGEK